MWAFKTEKLILSGASFQQRRNTIMLIGCFSFLTRRAYPCKYKGKSSSENIRPRGINRAVRLF